MKIFKPGNLYYLYQRGTIGVCVADSSHNMVEMIDPTGVVFLSDDYWSPKAVKPVDVTEAKMWETENQSRSGA